MSLTMDANFCIGTAKVSSLFFTKGLAEMSNMPSTARGRSRSGLDDGAAIRGRADAAARAERAVDAVELRLGEVGHG